MDIEADNLNVEHNVEARRFEIHCGNEMARLEYRLRDATIVYTHTIVPPALEGHAWAGDSTSSPPEELDAAIIFAPAGELVPAALPAVRKSTVVCGGIHMSDIPSFPYELLWGARTLCSVANVTRRDAEELLALAPSVPVRTEVERFALSEANEALDRLRNGRIRGAAVLVPWTADDAA